MWSTFSTVPEQSPFTNYKMDSEKIHDFPEETAGPRDPPPHWVAPPALAYLPHIWQHNHVILLRFNLRSSFSLFLQFSGKLHARIVWGTILNLLSEEMITADNK